MVGEGSSGLSGGARRILFGGELYHGVTVTIVVATAVSDISVVGTVAHHGVRGRDGIAAVTVGCRVKVLVSVEISFV